MRERWRPIVGYEGAYSVSDHGRIRSETRTINIRTRWGGSCSVKIKGGVKSLQLDRDGYLRVSLYRRSRMRFASVHRLVAEAFIPNPGKLSHVDHKDSDRANPHFKNLEWTTPKRNSELTVVRGRSARGAKNANAKLTNATVRKIRLRSAAGETNVALAVAFGVTDVCISKVVRCETWAHIA